MDDHSRMHDVIERITAEAKAFGYVAAADDNRHASDGNPRDVLRLRHGRHNNVVTFDLDMSQPDGVSDYDGGEDAERIALAAGVGGDNE